MLWGFAESRASGGASRSGHALCQKLYATYVAFFPGSASSRADAPPGPPGQLHRAVPHAGVRSVFRQHHQTRRDPGIALASYQGREVHSSAGGGSFAFAARRGRSGRSGFRQPACGGGHSPGDLHSIKNQGQDDLVTLIWASECFDPDRPDTYGREV